MHAWEVIHDEACAVTRERRDLLADVAKAANDPDQLAYLHGAVVEYDKGGDQEVENCTCPVADRYLPDSFRHFADDPYGATIRAIRFTIHRAVSVHNGTMSEGEYQNLLAIDELTRGLDNA